ncbi:MAG: methylenetetrahydrofolate reductase, partial [Gemmiger sp.]|nr:methylenetetrahydrofolate reductase [Gemmiger sp.]
MQIDTLFHQQSCVFSIECFPPKQTTNFAKMQDTLRSMAKLHPGFISVTYGAGGSAGGVSTVEVAAFIKNELGVEPLAHTICMGNDKAGMDALVAQLAGAGVGNVLALRGDHSPTRPDSPDFAHASDLVYYLLGQYPNLGVSAACYPEGHPESPTLLQDVANLKRKQQAGAGHLITQLFFDNG